MINLDLQVKSPLRMEKVRLPSEFENSGDSKSISQIWHLESWHIVQELVWKPLESLDLTKKSRKVLERRKETKGIDGNNFLCSSSHSKITWACLKISYTHFCIAGWKIVEKICLWPTLSLDCEALRIVSLSKEPALQTWALFMRFKFTDNFKRIYTIFSFAFRLIFSTIYNLIKANWDQARTGPKQWKQRVAKRLN